MINNYIQKAQTFVLNRHLHIFIIIFFQFFGTTLFSFGALTLVNLKGNSTILFQKVIYEFLDFSLTMFMCISYGRQFSGGLYNPAVAVFRTIRKTERYPIRIGLVYIISQIAGGITGSFIALFLNDVEHAPFTTVIPIQNQITNIITLILGTMVLTFMVQLIIEKKMTFIEHNREFYICIPMYYMVARTYSAQSNSVNPAFGIGFELVYCYKYEKWNVFPMAYMIIVGPILGAILSALLFQYGFRPMFPIKRQAVIKRELRKLEIELNEKKTHPLNNRWTLKEIITKELYPAMDEDFEFTLIAQEEIDDEIKSLDDEEEKQNFQPIFLSDLQSQLSRWSAKSKKSLERSQSLGIRSLMKENWEINEEKDNI